ncbi:hypothetical protein [Thermococcus camini]|uniref:Uncharacterized protein n=1 Tax=Thermococcus camini TaxID=2016373 RepID=A0A7G2DDI4_9EURY|nr:hypothetical protein [Thermococcus camini]CAD5245213.1 conserved membrane protein of unknown function [Thermococcus camini]
MYPALKLEVQGLKWKPLAFYAIGLTATPFLGEVSPLVPYFFTGFLFSAVFSGGLYKTCSFLLPKPYKRANLFAEVFISHLFVAFLFAIPFALLDTISFFFALFALPFLPLGYLVSLTFRNPRKTLIAGVLLFLLLTFVPPGIVQMKAQEKAQNDLGIKSLEDYEAKKGDYHRLVLELEKRYTTYAFFSPGAQLELFARDVEVKDTRDAYLRIALTLATFLAFTVLSFLLFLRFEPGAFIRPSPPALYITSLPWWIRVEIANLWASRAFVAFLLLMLLPFGSVLKAFGMLFLLPLATLEILSASPVLILSKPVGRGYLLRRFMVISALFAVSLPIVGASFGVAFFLASFVFLLGLFTRRGALLALPFLALLFAPAIDSGLASLLLMLLSTVPLGISAFRISRMDISAWGGMGED